MDVSYDGYKNVIIINGSVWDIIQNWFVWTELSWGLEYNHHVLKPWLYNVNMKLIQLLSL